MDQLDLTTQRVLALYIRQLEASLEQLKAAIAEKDKRIAELESGVKNE